jgi:DNA-binding NtrC family response regulator
MLPREETVTTHAADDNAITMATLVGPATTAVRRFSLQIAEGAGAAGDTGRSFLIDGASASRTYLGKSPSCDVRVDDPKVSRRHAALELVGDALHLVDLDSTNGTRVNGVQVKDALLRGGELLQVGDTTLRVVAGEARLLALPAETRFGGVLGASPQMRKLYPVCRQLAAASVPVVIEGETGTGKELLAEALHAASPRAGGPFVVLDCTTLPPTLIESALFGHMRGAFTGAVASVPGVFEQASGGTLLLDEIGDLALELQPKLLRAIERAEVRRVGGDRWIKVDPRIIVSTRRDLEREIQEGRFRDDLFFRIAVGRVELPPLRAREGDVALLARHFWQDLHGAADMPYDLLLKLERHQWPGNVRELYNVVARCVALGELSLAEPIGGKPGQEDAGASLEAFVDEVLSAGLSLPNARQRLVDAFERRYLERAVALHNGNVSRAAGAAGIARRYFSLLRARYKGGAG